MMKKTAALLAAAAAALLFCACRRPAVYEPKSKQDAVFVLSEIEPSSL